MFMRGPSRALADAGAGTLGEAVVAALSRGGRFPLLLLLRLSVLRSGGGGRGGRSLPSRFNNSGEFGADPVLKTKLYFGELEIHI